MPHTERVSSESIKTCIVPNGHMWGTDKWYDVYLQGEIVHTSLTWGRAAGRLQICAESRGIDLKAALAAYYNAFTAEIKPGFVTPHELAANITAEPIAPPEYPTDKRAAIRSFWGEARIAGLGVGNVETTNQRASRLAACAGYCGISHIESLRDLETDQVANLAAAIRRGELTWGIQ